MKGHILFGILNWGLGHASRSKLIIDELLRRGYSVTIASEGEALKWLQTEYPKLAFVKTPGYGIRYAGGAYTWLALLLRLPQMARAVRQERKLVRKMVLQNKIDGIISDNRLGFYHPELPSVYITHQLQIKAGLFSGILRWIHARYQRHYTECWVPDTPEHHFAGELSEVRAAEIPVHFLGPLSRFRPGRSVGEQDWVLAVLSGPEPQRSILEKKLLRQMAKVKMRFTIVSGGGKKPRKLPENVRWFGQLESKRLAGLIKRTRLVISRSGYSSIMDYHAMSKKALLIPTPGQYEQEYLADYHVEKGHFHCVKQSELQLEKDLEKALQRKGIKGRNLQKDINWEERLSLFDRTKKSGNTVAVTQ